MMIPRREEDRTIDVGGGEKDCRELARKSRDGTGVADRRARRTQAAIDAFHHDDGGIDDQAEIDCADRKQVRRLTPQHEDTDREEQCERDGGGDDQRAAQIAEKDPLQGEDQQDAKRHVVEDRSRGDVDEILAVVDPFDAHPRRQNVRIVDPFDFALDTLDRRHALFAPAHEHDTLDDVVVRVLAGDAEPRFVADMHRGHVPHQNRVSPALRQHRIAQFLRRADEPDAAHHRRLRADIDGVAADIDVAVIQRL